MLLLLFFLSGLSGLIYQVVWVRELGTVFGATIHTTSLVVAIFMLGLGAGSYLTGLWADRRYARAPESLLRAYGVVELLIAALGFAIAFALPHLQEFAARSSTYIKDPATGWFVLSPMSFVAQGGMALGLLGPSAFLMGGTLTLLIRHLVRADVEGAGGWRIALLYAVNTGGAAAGAWLTDYALVPSGGLRMTQFVAVALNIVAGLGALALSRDVRPAKAGRYRDNVRPDAPTHVLTGVASGFSRTERVVWTALALLLSGFAAMGFEIVWLRHFTLLLGGFRAVFSLLMTILLLGIGAGALAGGVMTTRLARPIETFMAVQVLLVVSALGGLAANSAATVRAGHGALEFWFNARPMLLEIGLPSFLMGCSFPLANAIIQHAEAFVGRRAGLLYLANTAGAVCGSLVTGYVLLPHLGMQSTATVLALAAGLTLALLYLASVGGPDRLRQGSGESRRSEAKAERAALQEGVGGAAGREEARVQQLGGAALSGPPTRGRTMAVTVASVVVVAIAIDAWLRLPGSYLLLRALPALPSPEKLVAVREGVTEAISITEVAGRGRALLTNGHAMSSTAPLDQRYMRALAHIPLLLIESSPPFLRSSAVESFPRRVLVIGFGVGNSTHAATLYPSVTRVDVADLSRDILDVARLFRDANADVLKDPRVSVYVNDGRQHLEMQPPATYDLITLEPPPIAHAGVGALYEFYALARSRLKPGGYLSQWLPAYQVPPATALAMTRAFVDAFPQSVLLSGMREELLLVGTTAPSIEIDPERLARTFAVLPRVLADLRRIDLGTVKEIVGTFVGSAGTLARATGDSPAVSDDRPLQEYGVRSAMSAGANGVPAALFDLPSAHTWCPRCFSGPGDDAVTAAAAGLDTYLALLDEAYHAPFDSAQGKPRAARIHTADGKVLGSAYLGAVLPDTAGVHNIVGVTLLEEKRYEEAAVEFRTSLKRRENSADANRNLGTALAAMGNREEAITYLRRATELAPDNQYARRELELMLQR